MVVGKINKKIVVCVFLSLLLVLSIIFNVLFINKHHKIKKEASENIVFFGDSITKSYKLDEFFARKHIVNKGVNGDRTNNLIDRIKPDVYEYNPTKVVILIGINDLMDDTETNDIMLNIQTIINGIKSNRQNAEIYVQSLYPVNETIIKDGNGNKMKKLKNKEIINANNSLKQICLDNKVIYINVFDSLLDKEGNLKSIYTTDGLHLSSSGYSKVTSILNNYINN